MTRRQVVTFDELAAEAERDALTIDWANVAGKFLGAADLSSKTIYLDHSLDSRPRLAVSILAHEMGHMALEHECSQDERGERRANEWAAKRLISPVEYALAEKVFGTSPQTLAVELGVSVELLEAFRHTLAA